MQLAQILEQKWKSLCSQARIPEYINQNEMDEILNVGSSWDRKRFGKSYKPVR
jgi:DNA-binding TFAR19-related protein (PDSD5 family)